MKFRPMQNKALFTVVAFLLIIAFISGTIMALAGDEDNQPILVVTGTGIGIDHEQAYTESELLSMNQQQVLYSTLNSVNKSVYTITEGVLVNDLLSLSGLPENHNDHVIRFIDSSEDKYTSTFENNYGNQRYYFPNAGVEGTGNNTGSVQVPIILAFKRAENSKDPADLTDDSKAPRLMVGQQTYYEQNNSLINKNVQTVQVGEPLPGVLCINDDDEDNNDGDAQYTRAELLLMGRIKGIYTYSTQGDDATDYVTGVSLAELLENYDNSYEVEFISADGYENAKVTVAQVKDPSNEYILAYKKGDAANNQSNIVDTAKSDANIKGYLRVYSKDNNPVKLVNKIKVAPKAAEQSLYKHLSYDGAPYKIDAITGATLTVEGPGVEQTAPLAVSSLENLPDEAVFRGSYTDKRDDTQVERTYEGVRLAYLLNNYDPKVLKRLENGEKILLKNRARFTVAEFSYQEVLTADGINHPIIIAWGTAMKDGTNVRPFVYDGGAGIDSELGNADGCLKLIYNQGNEATKKFGNVAYIYVAEDNTPGYKHDKVPYNDVENTQYILTLRGEALGREVNYTIEEIEAKVQYDGSGNLAADSKGYRNEYSLANHNYWYINEYEGLKLWDLLKDSGLDESLAVSEKETPVTFHAWDNVPFGFHFTLEEVANPDLFHFYERDPLDLGSNLNPSGFEPHPPTDITGYPIVLAYGVNGYPYVRTPSLEGYKSGLGNEGGPLKVIFGKKDYFHANGSNQVQKVDRIMVGDDVYYSTHKYNPAETTSGTKDYGRLANNKINISIIGEDGPITPVKPEFSVGEIEDMIYQEGLSYLTISEAKEKDYYYYKNAGNGAQIEDLFEGVNLWYFLTEQVGLPGQFGTVTFSNGSESITCQLQDLKTKGYNSLSGQDYLEPMLAFAKNGFPMVEGKDTPGYVGDDPNGIIGLDGKVKAIKNDGGPMAVVIPQTVEEKDNNIYGRYLSNVTSITINLETDKYAHLKEPYSNYADDQITFKGEGLPEEVKKNITYLESRQNIILTETYNIKSVEGSQSLRFRGIDLGQLLRIPDINRKANADEVIVSNEAGESVTLSIQDLTSGINGQKIILAYGMNLAAAPENQGYPLVSGIDPATGYDAGIKNNGGPMRLIVPQSNNNEQNEPKCIENVTTITVNLGETTSWIHNYGEYLAYYDKPTLAVSGSEAVNPKTFTLEDLEAEEILNKYLVKDTYNFKVPTQVQGIDLWNFLKDEVGFTKEKPTSISIKAADGYEKHITTYIDNMSREVGVNGKPIILGFGVNGYPLVPSDGSKAPVSPGYEPTAYNSGGPLRLFVENSSGECVGNVISIVIGSGSHQDPGDDIPEDAFQIKGNIFPNDIVINMLAIKGMEASVASYTYGKSAELPNGTNQSVKGVYLTDLLSSAGLKYENYPYTVTLLTSDGFLGKSSGVNTYENISITDIVSKNYFVAYEVDGSTVKDTDKNGVFAYYRIYRDYNDGTGWLNRATNIIGVEVKDPMYNQVVFSVSVKNYGNDNYSVAKEFTKAELMAKPGQEDSYTYKSGGAKTDTVTGVYLYDLLAEMGIKNMESKVTITTTDNFTGTYSSGDVTFPDTYVDIPLSLIKSQNYFVAYTVGGTPVKDTPKNQPAEGSYADGYVRVYRNFDAGNTWLNRITPAAGAKVNVVYNWKNLVEGFDGGLRCVVPDENGGVWLGTTNNGAIYINKEGVQTKHYSVAGGQLFTDWVYDIAPDAAGGVWITQAKSYMTQSENAGVVYINKDGVRTKNFTFSNTNEQLPDAANFVQQVEVDKQGNVWMGHFAGLTRYKPSTGEWQNWNKNHGLPATSVNTITPDTEGGLWIGCYPDNSSQDPQNGSYSGGYAYMSATGVIKTFTPEPSENTDPDLLADYWVRGIAVDNYGGAWVVRSGSYSYMTNHGGRIDYVSPDKNSIIHYTGKELLPDLENLAIPASETEAGFNPEVRVVTVDANGGIWFGTSGLGVYYCPEAGDVAAHYSSSVFDWPINSMDNVWALATLKNGDVWAGTNGGVVTNYIEEAKEDSGSGPGSGGEPFIGVTINGAVAKDKQLTIQDLKRLPVTSKIPGSYPFINSFGTDKSISVKGVELAWILENVVEMNSNAKSITVRSADGEYYREFNLDDEPSGVYYEFFNGRDDSDDTVYPMALAYQEGSTSYSDYPRLIMGMSTTMDKVPAGRNNAGKYYNGPYWVSEIATITVNTKTVKSGGGTSGAYEESLEEMEEESITGMTKFANANKKDITEKCTLKTDADGNKKYTLSNDIVDIIEDADTDLLLTITASDEEESFGIQIPAAVRQAAAGQKQTIYVMVINKNSGAVIKLTDLFDMEMATVAYNDILSPGVISDVNPYQGIISTADTFSQNSIINVKLTLLANDSAFAEAKKPWQELVGLPQELQIWLVSNGQETPISNLRKYLDQLVPIPEGIKGAETVGVQYDTKTGELRPLPTRFVTINGQRYAVLSTFIPGQVGVVNGKVSFKDMENHWAASDIQTMSNKLLINGKKEDIFTPNDSISRAEFAAMINRSLALLDQPLNDMKGVKSTDWFAQSMANMAAYDLLSGDDKGMRPNDPVSRAEIATILKRVASLFEVLNQDSSSTVLNNYQDTNEIPEWAKQDLAWATKQEIINGDNLNRINSRATATRAEGALMILRFLEKAELLSR